MQLQKKIQKANNRAWFKGGCIRVDFITLFPLQVTSKINVQLPGSFKSSSRTEIWLGWMHRIDVVKTGDVQVSKMQE